MLTWIDIGKNLAECLGQTLAIGKSRSGKGRPGGAARSARRLVAPYVDGLAGGAPAVPLISASGARGWGAGSPKVAPARFHGTEGGRPRMPPYQRPQASRQAVGV
jgi:hypothetical protein